MKKWQSGILLGCFSDWSACTEDIHIDIDRHQRGFVWLMVPIQINISKAYTVFENTEQFTIIIHYNTLQ